MFGWSRYEYIRNKAICTIQWRTSYSYAVAVIGLGVFVPFIVMIIAYMRIFSKARDIFLCVFSLAHNGAQTLAAMIYFKVCLVLMCAQFSNAF